MADLFWAGRYVGVQAIAGLGVAQDYTRLIMTGRMGLDMGMQAMVSRAIGAGRVDLYIPYYIKGRWLNVKVLD